MDPDSEAMHNELAALEAAHRIVDTEAAQDRAAGPPLPESEFDPMEALAAEVDSTMIDAQAAILDDAARDLSRMAGKYSSPKMAELRREAMARHRDDMKRKGFQARGTTGGGLSRGFTARSGFGSTYFRNRHVPGRPGSPTTPAETPEPPVSPAE
jgi:hypothetical protein